MSTNTTTNGQARKSLAEQIDRLDAVLDGLADGLNDAVSLAVKESVGAAVQQAVQAVVREALTSPELLARLAAVAAPAPGPAAPAPAAPPPVPPTSTAPDAPKPGGRRPSASLCRTLAAWAAAVRRECGRRLDQARRCAAGVWVVCRMSGRFWTAVVAGLGLGAAVGVGAYFAGPWLAAAARSVGAFAVAAAAQVRTAWARLTPIAVESIG